MLQWPVSWKGVHIMVKKLLSLVLGVALCGKKWFGDSLVCRCDNAAVVAILQSKWCKDDLAMHLLQCLFFWLATYQVKIVGKHIPGTQNGPANALSQNNVSSFIPLGPPCQARTIRGSSKAGRIATNPSSKLDISELDNLVGKYFTKGLAESTHRSCNSAQRCYLDFCRREGLQAIPATETELCYFVAFLTKEKLRHKTIEAYLLALRFLHIAEEKPNPFVPSLTHLQYVLGGVKPL